jgi:hypothetical protein
VRAILIVLVLVNLAWALWAGILRDGSAAEPAPTPRPVGTGLALLSELPADAVPATDTQPPAQTPEPTRPREQPKEVTSAPVATTPEPAAQSAGEAPDPEPNLEQAVASIGQVEVNPHEPQKCLAMGPFDELARVEALRDEVLAAGGSAEIVSEEIEGRPDYLVFIETTGSRAVARRIREELKGQEIDSHVIAGGDLENELSVGVFSREELARRQHERVVALGYEAVVEELTRRQTVYHLMADRAVSDPSVVGQAACHEIAAAHPF